MVARRLPLRRSSTIAFSRLFMRAVSFLLRSSFVVFLFGGCGGSVNSGDGSNPSDTGASTDSSIAPFDAGADTQIEVATDTGSSAADAAETEAEAAPLDHGAPST